MKANGNELSGRNAASPSILRLPQGTTLLLTDDAEARLQLENPAELAENATGQGYLDLIANEGDADGISLTIDREDNILDLSEALQGKETLKSLVLMDSDGLSHSSDWADNQLPESYNMYDELTDMEKFYFNRLNWSFTNIWTTSTWYNTVQNNTLLKNNRESLAESASNYNSLYMLDNEFFSRIPYASSVNPENMALRNRILEVTDSFSNYTANTFGAIINNEQEFPFTQTITTTYQSAVQPVVYYRNQMKKRLIQPSNPNSGYIFEKNKIPLSANGDGTATSTVRVMGATMYEICDEFQGYGVGFRPGWPLPNWNKFHGELGIIQGTPGYGGNPFDWATESHFYQLLKYYEPDEFGISNDVSILAIPERVNTISSDPNNNGQPWPQKKFVSKSSTVYSSLICVHAGPVVAHKIDSGNMRIVVRSPGSSQKTVLNPSISEKRQNGEKTSFYIRRTIEHKNYPYVTVSFEEMNPTLGKYESVFMKHLAVPEFRQSRDSIATSLNNITIHPPGTQSTQYSGLDPDRDVVFRVDFPLDDILISQHADALNPDTFTQFGQSSIDNLDAHWKNNTKKLYFVDIKEYSDGFLIADNMYLLNGSQPNFGTSQPPYELLPVSPDIYTHLYKKGTYYPGTGGNYITQNQPNGKIEGCVYRRQSADIDKPNEVVIRLVQVPLACEFPMRHNLSGEYLESPADSTNEVPPNSEKFPADARSKLDTSIVRRPWYEHHPAVTLCGEAAPPISLSTYDTLKLHTHGSSAQVVTRWGQVYSSTFGQHSQNIEGIYESVQEDNPIQSYEYEIKDFYMLTNQEGYEIKPGLSPGTSVAEKVRKIFTLKYVDFKINIKPISWQYISRIRVWVYMPTPTVQGIPPTEAGKAGFDADEYQEENKILIGSFGPSQKIAFVDFITPVILRYFAVLQRDAFSTADGWPTEWDEVKFRYKVEFDGYSTSDENGRGLKKRKVNQIPSTTLPQSEIAPPITIPGEPIYDANSMPAVEPSSAFLAQARAEIGSQAMAANGISSARDLIDESSGNTPTLQSSYQSSLVNEVSLTQLNTIMPEKQLEVLAKNQHMGLSQATMASMNNSYANQAQQAALQQQASIISQQMQQQSQAFMQAQAQQQATFQPIQTIQQNQLSGVMARPTNFSSGY